MATFTITTTRTQIFEEGWGVSVTPIWAGEDDERISDIEVDVVRIAEDAAEIIGNEPCVVVAGGMYVPIANFQDVDDLTVDDSHDLRTRFFHHETDAKDHARLVTETWARPAPWVSFVVLA